MTYFTPTSIHRVLGSRGWVVLATGPEDSQRAPALLRKRVYGAARRMNMRASTTNRVPGFILGWLRFDRELTQG